MCLFYLTGFCKIFTILLCEPFSPRFLLLSIYGDVIVESLTLLIASFAVVITITLFWDVAQLREGNSEEDCSHMIFKNFNHFSGNMYCISWNTYDITEILLKVALSTIKPTNQPIETLYMKDRNFSSQNRITTGNSLLF